MENTFPTSHLHHVYERCGYGSSWCAVRCRSQVFWSVSTISHCHSNGAEELPHAQSFLRSECYQRVSLPNLSHHSLLLVADNSRLVMATLDKLGFRKIQPRSASSMGWFSDYDANIEGGLLIGFGMALSGACPGTVLVQLAIGIRSGWLAMLGGILGGILHARFSPLLRSKRQSSPASSTNLTIQSRFSLDSGQVLLGYELMCLAMIGLVTLLKMDDAFTPLRALLGSLFIGGAQAASILLTSIPVGCSGTYAEIAQHFWRAWDSSSKPKTSPKAPPPSTRSMTFAVGIILGAFAMPRSNLAVGFESSKISDISAFAGGFAMIVGARFAGGCTSGHGISGMSTFSVSSIISVASMFAGGIGLGLLLKS